MKINPALEDFFDEQGLPPKDIAGRTRKLLNINGISQFKLKKGYLDPQELNLGKLNPQELRALYRSLYHVYSFTHRKLQDQYSK